MTYKAQTYTTEHNFLGGKKIVLCAHVNTVWRILSTTYTTYKYCAPCEDFLSPVLGSFLSKKKKCIKVYRSTENMQAGRDLHKENMVGQLYGALFIGYVLYIRAKKKKKPDLSPALSKMWPN